MGVKQVGVIVHGATGRIASTQHLANALAPICAEGGIGCGDDRILPKLLLVGRNAGRLAAVAARHGIAEWTTDLDAALARPDYSVFLDAAATRQRVATLHKAIGAGKHIYSEKPVAPTVGEGLAILRAAQARGLKHAAVEDKIYLPGLQKLLALARADFFKRITGFRLEFGWWVFDGAERPSQRPSWNYRRAGGGGMVSDMYPHWRYVIEGILGPVRRVVAATATALPERVDENGQHFAVDVDDVAMTLVELASGAIGAVVCSWATRVRGDDLLTLRVDGTGGSAVAGLHRCWTQSAAETPTVRHVNPDRDLDTDYRQGWQEVPGAAHYPNPYRIGWEDFLRHVVADTPIRADLRAGIRDVQFVEACYRSVEQKAWADIDDIA